VQETTSRQLAAGMARRVVHGRTMREYKGCGAARMET
jgi:hypothetical protein